MMGIKSGQFAYEVLGIPIGTAQNKLRKKILFWLISGQLTSTNNCYKCHQIIESDDDMTIEHKKPWLGREGGRELFWDMDNIAFSHKWCNRPQVNPGEITGPWIRLDKRKIGPEGTAWCITHKEFFKEFLDKEQFGKDKNRWNGLSPSCRSCRSKIRTDEDRKNDRDYYHQKRKPIRNHPALKGREG